MKEKYEISIAEIGISWRAILICHCRQTPEHLVLEEDNFPSLLGGINDALAQHEEREK